MIGTDHGGLKRPICEMMNKENFCCAEFVDRGKKRVMIRIPHSLSPKEQLYFSLFRASGDWQERKNENVATKKPDKVLGLKNNI